MKRNVARRFALLVAAASCATQSLALAAPPRAARNVVIFVADGLRAGSVNETDGPTLSAVRHDGVDFANSHSLFPTFTTPNASAIATGHYLGDTGDFSNNEYLGFRIFSSGNFSQPPGGPTPFLESDQVLGDLNDHVPSHNFLNEQTLLAAARAAGFNTAAIGKLGPAAIQDVTQVNPVQGRFGAPQTVILDDATGSDAGVPLAEPIRAALLAAGLELSPPPRDQPAGDVSRPGTLSANVKQQRWLVDATTKAVLPTFKASGKPFVLVYWSRDPDASQHNQGDSLNALVPGINGPTSRAAVANADRNLRQILDYVESDPTLHATTDVLVTADHGFATISRHEVDSEGHGSSAYAASFTYRGADGAPTVIPGWLPPGFLAIDLAHALGLPLFDPDTRSSMDAIERYVTVDPSRPPSQVSLQRPAQGNGLLGGTGIADEYTTADVVIAAGGGSDLIYLRRRDSELARRIGDFLSRQDYVGALFVDAMLGPIPGALPTSVLSLEGRTQMPRPAFVVAFKSFATDSGNPAMTTAQISDTILQQGQGMHGGLNRASTFINMAAIGPDFKHGFVDRAPVSNADVAPTLAYLLGLELSSNGTLIGRRLVEAIVGGRESVRSRAVTATSASTATGAATVLHYQEAGGRRYFDYACFVVAAERTTLCADDPRPSGAGSSAHSR